MYELAPCGLMLTSATGTILRMNATICHWLGYEVGDLLGKFRVQDLLTIGGKVFYQTHCAPLLDMQGSVAEVQLDMRRRDGERIPMLLNIARRQCNGTIFEEFALFIATDRKSYERELLAARRTAEASLEAQLGAEAKMRELNEHLSSADRKKDEFLATLAHELRNPLAPMSGALELLKLTLPPAEPHDRVLRILDRQLAHMTHLVDDLMEASRITQGRMELRREPLLLAGIIEAAANDVEGLMASARHSLQVNLPADDIVIDGDSTRLSQIVVNLLTNAAKYTPNGGSIILTVERQEQEAIISIRDDGIGIPQESLSSVFEMFSQLEPALQRSKGGLGIGLALVRGLVRLHGGSIEANSRGQGLGSEFLVRLPITASAIVNSSVPSSARTASLRMLVVDDNSDAADMLAETLRYFGHEIRVAYDGVSALREAAAFLPHAALLDIGLPDMTGYALAARIRQELWGKSVRLVAATGWGQASDKQLARDAGFDEHLTKPVDFDKLHSILARIGRFGST
jgi:PAS domain S-box-containing protein